MTGCLTDAKIAVAEIRRLRATAKALKWSRKLMEAQIVIVDALPTNHPRRVQEKRHLKEFMELGEHVRAVAPKRSGGAS